MRRGGALVAIVASLFYVFAGFYRLLQFKKYVQFAFVFLIYFGLALLLYFGFTYSWNLDVPDMRVWAVTPFIFLLLSWLMSGFFVRKYVANVVSENRFRLSKARLKIRIFGTVLFGLGLSIWLYGNFHPFNDRIFIWALLFSVICMVLGVPYMFTGRKMSEADNWVPGD